jgi:hypothetical protein
MDPMRLVSRFTEQKTSHQTYIPKQTEASLDDLYAMASTLGEVKMGLTFDSYGVEIKLHKHSVKGDSIWIRSTTFPTIKENLAASIVRAEKVLKFYQSI